MQLDPVLEQRFRFEQRFARRQQQIVALVFGLPALRRRRDACTDTQVLAILRHPLHDARPVPEQRFMRHGHDGTAVVGELGDEQTVVDECLDSARLLPVEAAAQGARLRPTVS